MVALAAAAKLLLRERVLAAFYVGVACEFFFYIPELELYFYEFDSCEEFCFSGAPPASSSIFFFFYD